jgi:DNA-directed RNA polymerase specialized sigma24 family protein
MSHTTREEREERRREVARLFHKGLTQSEIATRLGWSEPTISRDLERLRESWQDEAELPLDEHIQEHLALLRMAVQDAYTEWRRERDPSMLRALLQALRDRADVLGLEDYDPPTEEDTGDDFYEYAKRSIKEMIASAQKAKTKDG